MSELINIKTLRDNYGLVPASYHDNRIAELKAERDNLDEINERHETALHEIKSWINAYPLDVFPEPDFGEVNFALEEAGLSLSQVSASNMRHVLNGIDKIILRSEVTR